MEISNVIKIAFAGRDTIRLEKALTQYDYGQVLQFVDLDLPQTYTVLFSNSSTFGTAKPQLGGASGVRIPDEYLATGKTIYAWLILHAGTDDGKTVKTIIQPVTPRPAEDDAPPTPVQQSQVEQLIAEFQAGVQRSRVTPLLDSGLAAGAIIDAVGIPVYISDVTAEAYAAYGLQQTGWYVFGRIAALAGTTATEQTTVTGADGAIVTPGAAYVDVAVRFEVAAMSKAVTVNWGALTETYVFRADDLAIRNLDYRTTFYVYDASDFATWSYALTSDGTFSATKRYYVEHDGVYTLAQVETVAYVLTADATFQDGKTYYTETDGEYTAATVTTGESVAENTYYEQTTVTVPAYYMDAWTLTTDTTFQDGKTYYTESDGEYTAATVTTGEAVAEDTYYEHSYVRATGTFQEGVTYYTLASNTYTPATVTAGEWIPAYYNHSKVTFSGMARNITYQLPQVVDCPSEFILPEIDDDTHGCWFEIRLMFDGQYSMTLTPPSSDIKVATEHTQQENTGLNIIDLHYSCVAGTKLWRFLNTRSTLPAAT